MTNIEPEEEIVKCGYIALKKILEDMTPAERKKWEENQEREIEEAKKKPQPKGYDGPTFI